MTTAELVLATARPGEAALRRVRAYLDLTKPGISVFMAMAAAGSCWLAGATPRTVFVLGSATLLAAAGAAVFNQVLERDADARMRRTSGRPLPSGAVTLAEAVAVGTALTAAGLLWSAARLPLAATVLLAASHASYVVVYTPLKRKTSLCTLAGALPGALPVLAGWMAAGAPVDAAALALAGVLYLWQLPHFLSIGWLCREDYRRGGFRVLAANDPDGSRTGRHALAYAAALLPVSVVPWWAGTAGVPYLAAAVALGGAYAWLSGALLARPGAARARRLFFGSLLYLPLLFGALIVDGLLR